jgi:hypothetical protein
MDYEEHDEYEENLFQEFGEGFETDFDAVSEQSYETAFVKEEALREGTYEEPLDIPLDFVNDEENINEDDYEFDSVVGGRDKKPVMSLLNKGKLSKYEMDELLNEF